MRTVSDLMTRGPLIIDRQHSLAEATTRMEGLRLRHLPVIDGGLIVIGTHGRTGLRRALLGSVAETVVRRARCQVLVCRRGETPAVSKENQS